MTDAEKDMERRKLWVIRKGNYFYRPNAQGYTEFLSDAGVWPEDEAVKHNNDDPFGPVKAFPYSEWEAKISAGSPDEFISNQADTITTLRAEVERLTEERDTIATDLVDERDEARAASKMAIDELCRWRSAFQSVTPGGSEFMLPESVIAWARKIKDDTHETKMGQVRLRAERDAAIARAEKAEAALAKMRDHYDNVDMSHEAFRVMASVEADKVLGGRYEAEAVAFVESLTEGE